MANKLTKIKIVPDLSGKAIVQNDTFEAWSIVIEDDERVGQTMTFASVNFVNESDSSEFYLDTDSGLTISGDTLTIDRIASLGMHSGVNEGQLEVTWSNGDVVTLVVLQMVVLADTNNVNN